MELKGNSITIEAALNNSIKRYKAQTFPFLYAPSRSVVRTGRRKISTLSRDIKLIETRDARARKSVAFNLSLRAAESPPCSKNVTKTDVGTSVFSRDRAKYLTKQA